MTKGNPNDSSMKLGFVAKVLDDGSYKPIYIAPDSTDKVRGDVYLSDSTSSTSNAATGVTAASPAAVKAANDNANNRLSKTDTNAQTVAGPITFSNTITASKTISGNVSGNAATATKLATARNITVRTNSNSKTDATASFNGSAAITLNLSSIDAGAVNTGTLPLSVIPKGALERLVSVADQTARFKLTTDSVQLGDTVQQTDTGVLYIVVDESNLGNAKGYVEYKAGTALSAQEATHATSADSATKATNDSAGNNINTT